MITRTLVLLVLSLLAFATLAGCGGGTQPAVDKGPRAGDDGLSLSDPGTDSTPGDDGGHAGDDGSSGGVLDARLDAVVDVKLPGDTVADPGDAGKGGLACTPGASRCHGLTVQLCVVGGTRFADEQACDLACVTNGGRAKCGVCQPDQTRCSATVPNTVERCAIDGLGWEAGKDCDTVGAGLTCFKGQCLEPCSEDFKLNTNVGCDYWAVELDKAVVNRNFSEGRQQFAVVVANVDNNLPTTVTVFRYEPGFTSPKQVDKADVPAGEIHTFILVRNQINGTVKEKRSFRIRASRPIVAYQFNPLNNVGVFSNDASMLLPGNALGTRYRVLGWPGRGEFMSYMTIVGTQPDTRVTITVTAPTHAGGGIPAMLPGASTTETIGAFEVISIATADPPGRNYIEKSLLGSDLSGSVIEADKPVAVFFGTQASNVPGTSPCVDGRCQVPEALGNITCKTDLDCPGPCCADHLEQQLIPEPAWGRTYVGARSQPRGKEKDVWRVMAQEDNTRVVITPEITSIPRLGAGKIFQFESPDSFVIKANKPILLGQFLASQNAPNRDDGGRCTGGFFICCDLSRDLCSFLCQSDSDCSGNDKCVRQNGTCSTAPETLCSTDLDCTDVRGPGDAGIGDPAYILAVPVEQLRSDYVFFVPSRYKENFITIYRETTKDTATQVTLDGIKLITGWKPIAKGWQVLHRLVEDGIHRMKGSGPFGVIVHGYDKFVSYGYPAGMNVTTLGSGP